MKKTLFTLLTVATLFATVSPATAGGKDGEIELLTDETAAVTAGDTAWLALNWTAEGGDVSDVAVVLRKEPKHGVVVTYPTNTATWTGLMNGHQLDDGEIDFTALRVHVPASFTRKDAKLELEVTYTVDGKQESDKFDVKVPVVQYSDGDHIVQHDSATTIPAGSSAWVEVDLTGLAPMVGDVKLTATGTVPIVYPGYGSSTSPHGDDVIEDGETDTARFRVDTDGVAPGEYTLATELTYTFAGTSFVRPGTATVTVG